MVTQNSIKVLMLGEGLDRQGGIVSLEKLILQSNIPNIEFVHIATLVNSSEINKALGYGYALIKLVQYLFFWKPDLIHIHVSEGGSAFRQAITILITKAFNYPIIMHTHGPEFRVFYKRLTQPVQLTLRWIFGQCDQVIALSESWKDFYVKELELKQEQVIVLPNPVKIPANIPDRNIRNQKILFTFLGRIGQRKGAFDIIHSFARIPNKIRAKAALTLAGDGAVEEAKKLINQLELEDCITVKSWLDVDQRNDLLAEGDVFILPSYNEGFPMALLEAMSWGLAIITTPVGGIPEVIRSKENGLLVIPGDIDQLAAAIELLIENKELRVTLGAAARKSVLPFDLKQYYDSLAYIYSSILAKASNCNDKK
jgi:glycosyltransferase involved in cell wall biosynthesis